jgi:hypothetical protein
MTIEIVTAIIALIEQMLPVLGTSAATATLIESIINALTKLLPLIIDLIPTVYQSIKNIIIELKADPATTAAQWAALDVIDTQLDAANDAAIAAVDPDVPPAAPIT